MRGKWSMQTAVAALCLLSVIVVLVSAECPNGCSGNGDCQSKDMCNCYMNYQGNDCADRTCLFGHAFVDTPKGDINMDKDRLTPGWLLKDSQQHPAMTYEHFNPDAIADEAHFYMECSNKGICDRSTGLCQCFDGYEGNGCRRMTCPGKCSGHGTCESIRELGLKAGGTLFGNEGTAGPVKYDLWDANSTYGCRCDPWYHGPDCAKRSCKVGVDPLFLSAGTPTYETFVVHAGDAALAAGAWIRLRLFDYYGESYITTKIPVLDDATAPNAAVNKAANIKAVADAIKAVPNLTFRTVSCGEPGLASSSWVGFLSVRPTSLGLSVVCQFSNNPGKIRLPEIADSNGITTVKVVTTTTQHGFDDEWFNVKPDNIVASSINVGTKVVTVTSSSLTALAVPQLVKIGADIVLVNAATTTALTLEFPMMHTLATSTQVFTSELIASVTAGPSIGAALAVGDDTISYVLANDPTTAHPVGSILFFHNQFFTVQANWWDATNTLWRVKLSKPFGGDSGTGAAVAVAGTALAYKVVLTADAHLKGYKYVSECSGRGMCGYDTGVCTCFKGYTNDNCDTQNILAL